MTNTTTIFLKISFYLIHLIMDELTLLFGINVIEAEEANNNREQRAYNRNLRINPFDQLNDNKFLRLFRLNKELGRFIIDLCSDIIPLPSRKSALDVTTKVLIALRFFASGSYELDIGSNIFLGVSQSSISRAIHEVVEVLISDNIFNRFITFSNNIREMNVLRNGFYRKYGFPGVVGCIDCTHVATIAPRANDPRHLEHIYVNRKKYHSINVQLICDFNLKIININSQFPGSTHDAFIWNSSNAKTIMETIYRNGRSGFYLLGDSGYALRPWCLTPLENDSEENTPEENYNLYHKRARSIIKRCNRLLKMRFRCLLKHRVLHYSPTMAAKIINACAVLHNLCIDHNVPAPNDNEEEHFDYGMIENDDNRNDEQRVNPDLVEARRMQQRLIANYFN